MAPCGSFTFELKPGIVKKLILILWTVVLGGFAMPRAAGQSVNAKPTAITWFSIAVEEDMYLTMDLDPETMFALMLQQKNDDAELLMYESFELVRDYINAQTALEVLEAASLKDKVTYSRMGYPLSSLKKAAKKADYEQYAKLEIEVRGAKRGSSEGTTGEQEILDVEVSESNYQAKVFPQIDVRLKFADATGKTIETITGRYRHTEKVQIKTQSLNVGGLSIPLKQSAEVIPYYYYLQKALEDLAPKLPSD